MAVGNMAIRNEYLDLVMFLDFQGFTDCYTFPAFPSFSSPGALPKGFPDKFYAECTDPGVERTIFAPNLTFLFIF